MMLLLGCALGGIAALPLARWARRETIAARIRPLGRRPAAVRTRSRPTFVAPVVRITDALRQHRLRRRRDAELQRELPVVVDLVGVAVAAGCTPYLAIEHAVRYAPARVGATLGAVPRACALGQSLDAALRDLGVDEPVLRPLTDVLRTSARLGSPAAPALARVAGEVRADVRRRAEARARTVPVRLCFPLVACVLPAFALLTVAPAVLGGLPS
jgi:Flp pilus assembly protein TadB